MAANLISIGTFPSGLIYDFPAGNNQNAVGKIQNLIQVFADQEYRRTAMAGRKQLTANLGGSGGIQSEARVLCNEESDVLGKFTRQHHALHVST
jgi:hypothetical protein